MGSPQKKIQSLPEKDPPCLPWGKWKIIRNEYPMEGSWIFPKSRLEKSVQFLMNPSFFSILLVFFKRPLIILHFLFYEKKRWPYPRNPSDRFQGFRVHTHSACEVLERVLLFSQKGNILSLPSDSEFWKTQSRFSYLYSSVPNFRANTPVTKEINNAIKTWLSDKGIIAPTFFGMELWLLEKKIEKLLEKGN